MKFDKKSLIRFLREKRTILSLILITILSVLGFGIFTGIIYTPWTNPFSCFEGPSYVPEGYLSTDNNTTNVDKTFIYQNKVGNYFMVAATNDPQKSEFEALKNPFEKGIPKGLDFKEENLVVDGHNVIFQSLNVNFMNLNRNIFTTTWTCPNTCLTIFVIGSMESKDIEEMKKMVASIQCHQKGYKWNLSELKNVIMIKMKVN